MAIAEESHRDGAAHLSLVESACLRPKMYTLNGTYAELVCFLEGLFSGRHPTTASSDGERWFRLGHHLKYDLFEGIEDNGWQAGFDALLQRSPDDQTALRDLARLYRDLPGEPAS